MKNIRKIIKTIAPEAQESISYGMPAYKLKNKPLIYFAGYEKHIGVYPTPAGIERFEKAFKSYKHAKGSVQFPLEGDFPYDLVQDIVTYMKEKIQNEQYEKTERKKAKS